MQISQASQPNERMEWWRKGGRDARTDIRLAMGRRMLGIVKFAGECFSSTPPKEAPGTKGKNITNHLALCAYLWPHGPLPYEQCKRTGVCVFVWQWHCGGVSSGPKPDIRA